MDNSPERFGVLHTIACLAVCEIILDGTPLEEAIDAAAQRYSALPMSAADCEDVKTIARRLVELKRTDFSLAPDDTTPFLAIDGLDTWDLQASVFYGVITPEDAQKLVSRLPMPDEEDYDPLAVAYETTAELLDGERGFFSTLLALEGRRRAKNAAH